MMSSSIPVLIAGGQPLYMAGLARTILRDSGLRLVAELDDGRAGLEAIRRLRPDVALLDVDMPGLDGRRVLNAVVCDELDTGIILLAADVQPQDAFETVVAGARGYLSKRLGGDRVVDAIRRVASGGGALCEDAQTELMHEVGLRHRDDQALLPPRERAVLALVAQGLDTAEIAGRLHVAPTTVKSYIGRTHQRLGTRDRAHAVAEAMRRGLLD